MLFIWYLLWSLAYMISNPKTILKGKQHHLHGFEWGNHARTPTISKGPNRQTLQPRTVWRKAMSSVTPWLQLLKIIFWQEKFPQGIAWTHLYTWKIIAIKNNTSCFEHLVCTKSGTDNFKGGILVDPHNFVHKYSHYLHSRKALHILQPWLCVGIVGGRGMSVYL